MGCCRCSCHCPPPAPKDPPDTDWLELWSGSEPAPRRWGGSEWLVTGLTLLLAAAFVAAVLLA